MTVTLGGAVPGVVSTRTDFWPHPRGRWAPPCTADLELADLTEDDQHLAERMGALRRLLRQFEKPTGRFGRFAMWTMNMHHSKGTDWGLQQISIERDATILDVGCGGGRTVHKLAGIATEGKVYGIDFSDESVAASRRTNQRELAGARSRTHPLTASPLHVSIT